MNRKRKGSYNERKCRDVLKNRGYDLVIKAGGSLGLFDLIGIGADFDHCLLIQVKSNRKPTREEMDILRSFQVPKFARKELWVFKDYVRTPEIISF